MPHWVMVAVSLALVTTQLASAQEIAEHPRLPVDLELVLAADISSSIDVDELRIQREGYAAALSHPAITSALQSGRLGRIALIYAEWGKSGGARVIVDWTLVQSAEDALQISQRLLSAPVVTQNGTSISGIMEIAGVWIEQNDYEGSRRVIDISGDGPNNEGRPVLEVRAELASKGIEVNGLAIMVRQPVGYFNIDHLDRYYEDCVVTGVAPFVVPVHDMDGFGDALRLKLIMEIAGRSPADNRLWRVQSADCLVGEKLRWRFENLTGDTR